LKYLSRKRDGSSSKRSTKQSREKSDGEICQTEPPPGNNPLFDHWVANLIEFHKRKSFEKSVAEEFLRFMQGVFKVDKAALETEFESLLSRHEILFKMKEEENCLQKEWVACLSEKGTPPLDSPDSYT